MWYRSFSCSEGYGIFPDQRSNQCILNWQMDSLPLRHQGSPEPLFMLMISMPSPPHWSPSFQMFMGCGTPSFLLHACFLGMCFFCLVLLFILSLIAACLIQVCRLCSSLWKIYPHICVVFPVVTSVLSSYKYYF